MSLARRHLPASLLITSAVIQATDGTRTDSPVVTLGSHTGVGEAQDGSKAVAAQVTLPSTPLSACCCCLLQQRPDMSFINFTNVKKIKQLNYTYTIKYI